MDASPNVRDTFIDLPLGLPDSILLAPPSATCLAQLSSFTPQDPSGPSDTFISDGGCPIWIDQQEHLGALAKAILLLTIVIMVKSQHGPMKMVVPLRVSFGHFSFKPKSLGCFFVGDSVLMVGQVLKKC